MVHFPPWFIILNFLFRYSLLLVAILYLFSSLSKFYCVGMAKFILLLIDVRVVFSLVYYK